MKIPRVSALPATALLLALAPPAMAEVVNGTSGPDVLHGTARADTIRGYAGADIVFAHGGADRIFPGDGERRDVLRGGPGPDRINARTVDAAYGGAGNDTIRILEVRPWAAYPLVSCGPGEDTLVLPYGVDYGPHPDCEHVRSAPSPFD